MALLMCSSGCLTVAAEGEGCEQTCANGMCYNPCTGEISVQENPPTVDRTTIKDIFIHENSLMMTIVNYILAAGMIFGIIMLIMGAIKLVGANISGMPHEKIKGYNTIKMAAIGIILIGGFGFIVNFAFKLFQ